MNRPDRSRRRLRLWMARFGRRDTRGRSGRRSAGWWPVGAVVVTAIVVLATQAAHGGFTASIVNAGDQVQSGSLLTAASASGTTECDLGTSAYSPITAANTAGCSSTLAPSGILPSSATTAQATTVSDSGSLAGTSTTLTKTTCGPVMLANSVTSSDPMLVRGSTLSYAQTGPLTGSAGLGLSGGSSGTGYAAEVTPTTYTATSAVSEAVWFKTTSTTGGTLMGFTDTPASSGATAWDKLLWVDNSGKVVFGVSSALTTTQLTSPARYNDGAWHLAVGTVSLTGMSLSIDGTTVASNLLSLNLQSFAGYWHVGWDNEAASFPDSPTTPYFAGTLADAAVLPVLTAAQITALDGSASQSAWNANLTADGAVKAWALGDDGTTAYAGAVPGVAPNACAFADVTVGATGATTTCAAPVSPSPCSAPSNGLTLGSLAASTSVASNPSPGQTLGVTITLSRDATNTVSAYPLAAGLHLTTALAVVTTNRTFSATLNWPSENVIL